MLDRDDEPGGVAVVEAGDGVVEVDGGAAAARSTLSEGSDGGLPVDGGHGRAAAGFVADESAGEVVAVQERAVAGEQGDAGFEGVEPGGAGPEGGGQVVTGNGGFRVVWLGLGCGGDVAVGGDAEADGFGSAGGGQVGLGEFAGGGVEADLKSFGFAGPAFALGFGDAGEEVVADAFKAAALGGVDPRAGSGARARGCSWLPRPGRSRRGRAAALEVAEELFPFLVVGDAVFLGRAGFPSAGDKPRWPRTASPRVGGRAPPSFPLPAPSCAVELPIVGATGRSSFGGALALRLHERRTTGMLGRKSSRWRCRRENEGAAE